MRLEYLIRDIDEEMYRKVSESRHDLSEEEARKIAKIIGLSAIKYGDLSNQASKDYIFDIDRFTSFEGDTVRIFCIPSCVLNRSLPSIRSRERAWKTCAWRRRRALPKKI